ncbi:MAG TPA: hypothetical protein PK156_47110, partial [Polyangium sp.]|nr:hypothetical protein [Polyangium sp.]
KIYPNGNVGCRRSLDIPGYARAIAIGPENRVVVLSETGSRTIQIVIPPPQKYDRFYLTTFTADGELLWEQSFGGDSSRQIQCDTNNGDVAIDNQGNAIVAGSFNGTFETPLGAFQTSPIRNDIVFVKVEPNGTIVAAKHFDAPQSQYLYDLAIDGTNHALAVVGENGSQSVMKLDESFSVVWTKGVSADAPVYSPKYVAIGADDKILLAGVFDGTDPAQPMKQWFPFLAQWDAAGNQVSNKAFSESQVDGLSFAAKLSGEFVFGVDFSSPINLGGGTISNYETSNDSVLARYSADGTYTAGAYVGGLGSQYTTAIALTPQGPTYWATHYWDSLTYGDQMLVEPLPPDSQAMTRLQGTALFALPP